MDPVIYNNMMQGLVSSAVEKINVLGYEDANKYISRIRFIVDDLEMFWNSNKDYCKTSWSEVLETEINKIR